MPDVMSRKPRDRRDPVPSASDIELEIRDCLEYLRAILPLWRRGYEQAWEPGRRGDGIPVTGGDPANVPYEMLENARALVLQHFLRSQARQLREARKMLGNVATALEEQLAPGALQLPRDKARAVVSAADFELALRRKAERGRRGEE